MTLCKKLSVICFVLIATISLSICPLSVSAATVAPTKTYTKGSVTASVLNVRSGPGKTYKKIGALKKGASVTILSRKAGWSKVQYKSRTGYISDKYIKARK